MKQAAKKQLLNAQKVDMLRYLKVEHKELIAGFKENVEC